jgi:hypothetical protein
MGTGLGVWLGTAYAFSGEVSVASTGGTLPCMYGTVASLFSPMLYSIIISLIRPENYDWNDFKEEKLVIDSDENEQQQSSQDKSVTSSSTIEIPQDDTQRRWARYALWWAIATFLGHWVLWPLPMYAANYVFSKTVRLPFCLLFTVSNISIVLHCVDRRVSHMAVVDIACSGILSNLGWSRAD